MTHFIAPFSLEPNLLSLSEVRQHLQPRIFIASCEETKIKSNISLGREQSSNGLCSVGEGSPFQGLEDRIPL